MSQSSQYQKNSRRRAKLRENRKQKYDSRRKLELLSDNQKNVMTDVVVNIYKDPVTEARVSKLMQHRASQQFIVNTVRNPEIQSRQLITPLVETSASLQNVDHKSSTIRRNSVAQPHRTRRKKNNPKNKNTAKKGYNN